MLASMQPSNIVWTKVRRPTLLSAQSSTFITLCTFICSNWTIIVEFIYTALTSNGGSCTNSWCVCQMCVAIIIAPLHVHLLLCSSVSILFIQLTPHNSHTLSNVYIAFFMKLVRKSIPTHFNSVCLSCQNMINVVYLQTTCAIDCIKTQTHFYRHLQNENIPTTNSMVASYLLTNQTKHFVVFAVFS